MATAAPFLARVVAGLTPVATGNQSFTSPGIGTPAGAIVIVTFATANDTYAAHASISWGVTDGSNQRACSSWSDDNLDVGDANSAGSTSKIVRLVNPATDLALITGTFNAWVTDGIQINFTAVSLSQYRVIVVLFSGTQCECVVGDEVPNASGGGAKKVTTGFAQDVVFTNIFRSTDESTVADMYHQPGFATRDNTRMGFVGSMDRDNQGTSQGTRTCNNDGVAQTYTLGSGAPLNGPLTTLNNHVSDGFDITTSGSGTGARIAYLAMKVTGSTTVGCVMTTGRATPGSTGTEAATWPGHKSGFLMFLTNLSVTVNNEQGQAPAGGICVTDARTHRSAVITCEDNVGTSNTASLNSTAPFESPLSTQAASAAATFSSQDSSGYTLNFSAVPGTATLYHGLSIQEMAQILSPTGISSGESFGTPYMRATIGPTGIASAQALGTPTIQRGTVTVSPTGIASAQAFGTPTIQRGTVTVSPSGIASAQAFGTPTIGTSITVSPSGVASSQAFGTPTILAGAVVVSPSGIASGEAFGTPTITTAITVSPSGIASGAAFGNATILAGGVVVNPSGIASGEALGTPTVIATVTILPTGIASAQAFGNATIVGGSVTLAPTGITSGEAFGNATLQAGVVIVSPSGIASGAAFGSPTVLATNLILPAGIPSGAAFGNATVLSGGVFVIPSGIPSGEAFGNASVVLAGSGTVLVVSGIPSAEAFGRPFLRGGLIPITMKKKVYDALCEAAHQGMFLAATYDSEAGCTLVQGLQIMPASVEANEISGSYEIARNYGRDFIEDNRQWQWLLILRFHEEAITEFFEQSLLKSPPCIKRDYTDPESRQIRLLLLDCTYKHPPREGPSNGTEVRYRFAADLSPIK